MRPLARTVRALTFALVAALSAVPAIAGNALVQTGVSFSPPTIYASPDQSPNFTSTFTLREVAGSPVTFTEIALAVHYGDGTFFFDVGKYSNVTVGTNGTWQFPPTARYLAAPGNYQLIAKGRVNNGAWFNFGVTGSGVNPRGFSVQPGVSIHGHVSSQGAGNPPVAGAAVSWGSSSTTTDASGNFVFTAIPCGTATLTVSKYGYYTSSQSYAPTCNAVNTPGVALAPWGNAGVGTGVTITPGSPHASVSSAYHNFSVDFTLREITGFPITFAEVGVAILDANNNHLFDLAPPNLQNVTVPAGGTWTYPTKTGYLLSSGTYRAVVRGRVEGGNWFDFFSAGGSNPATFTVQPALTPSVSVSPPSGVAGTVFSQPGFGFSPNREVELHFRKPPPPGGDGLEYDPPYPVVQADASGNYSHTYNSSTASMWGTYEYWAIDLTTGARSNTATFQLSPVVNPVVTVSPTSGITGTIFSQPGSGFTPHGIAELHFRKPQPPFGDGLEYAPPYPTRQVDASGNYSHTYNSATASQYGTYEYWAIDLATGLRSNTFTFDLSPPPPPVVSVSPSAGEAGTVFSQPGTGFRPNAMVELHFRKPPPPGGDGLEYAPPYPLVQADASGNYQHVYNSSSASMFGTYEYWAIDQTNGARSNTATFLLTPLAAPVSSVQPAFGPAGTLFAQSGTGCLPNSTIELHFRKPSPPGGDGLQYDPPYVTVQSDASGNFTHAYNSITASQFGTYQFWFIDRSTNLRSNTTSFAVGQPLAPTVLVSPTSGERGTTFSQTGTGFTPNSTVELHFRKPPPPDGDGLEYGPPHPTATTDHAGRFEHLYDSSNASQFGSYDYWAIDLATGRQSATTSFELIPPCVQSEVSHLATSAMTSTPCSGPQTFRPPVGTPNVTTGCGFDSKQCFKKGWHHSGIDYSASSGPEIRAAAAGIVHKLPMKRGSTNHNMGNCVIIDHERLDGTHIYSLYAHLEKIEESLVEGERVCRGRVIGKMGHTGGDWDTHLHFEIKDQPELGNPPDGAHGANQYWGYMPSDATEWGYQDPEAFFDTVPVKAVEVSTASITLTPSPVTTYYYPGDVITCRFVLTNTGNANAHLDVLLLSGRGPGGDEDIVDFPARTNIDIPPGGSYTYDESRALPKSGQYRFAPAFSSGGIWQRIMNRHGDKVELRPTVLTNLAKGRPCAVSTNGAEDHSTPFTGQSASDVVDGSLSYAPVSSGAEDGCVAWQNNHYNQLLKVTATISLQQISAIRRIRYNMGNCQRADTWGADFISSGLGRTAVLPGSGSTGAWTQQSGVLPAQNVSVTLEKTRTSAESDWLLVGEIEAWGIPPAAQSVAASSIQGPNNGAGDPGEATGLPDGQFVALGSMGEIVLDLGTDLLDAVGPDLHVSVVSGTSGTGALAPAGASSYTAFASEDGAEWSELGTSFESSDFDFAAAGLGAVRYVLILDNGEGDSLSAQPGVHLDAVVMSAADQVTSVEQSSVPAKLSLTTPRPNPSHGATSFVLDLPRPGHVALRLYDIAGRVIRDLVGKPMEAGRHTMRWDGTDRRGAQVQPGVYFCELTMGSDRALSRFVLVR